MEENLRRTLFPQKKLRHQRFWIGSSPRTHGRFWFFEYFQHKKPHMYAILWYQILGSWRNVYIINIQFVSTCWLDSLCQLGAPSVHINIQFIWENHWFWPVPVWCLQSQTIPKTLLIWIPNCFCWCGFVWKWDTYPIDDPNPSIRIILLFIYLWKYRVEWSLFFPQSPFLSPMLYIYIWIDYNDLTATSLEWWLQ